MSNESQTFKAAFAMWLDQNIDNFDNTDRRAVWATLYLIECGRFPLRVEQTNDFKGEQRTQTTE